MGTIDSTTVCINVDELMMLGEMYRIGNLTLSQSQKQGAKHMNRLMDLGLIKCEAPYSYRLNELGHAYVLCLLATEPPRKMYVASNGDIIDVPEEL